MHSVETLDRDSEIKIKETSMLLRYRSFPRAVNSV